MKPWENPNIGFDELLSIWIRAKQASGEDPGTSKVFAQLETYAGDSFDANAMDKVMGMLKESITRMDERLTDGQVSFGVD